MLASQGARSATRNASNFIPHNIGGGGTSRGIHIPPCVRVHPSIPKPGQAQKLFTQSRNVLAQFFNHLTTPGLRAPNPPSIARPLHSATRSPSIQQGFSLHVRTALSQPLRPSFLPRAPPSVPRTMVQVGLGTARNFSSGRHIFQNLVENVPIAGRAFYEADWELKMPREREIKKSMKTEAAKSRTGKEMLKPRARNFSSTDKENKCTSNEGTMESKIGQYFSTPSAPDVTTFLLIPLAPTPTARAPLAENPLSSRLLPLPALASLHASYGTHSLRVSSLFSRLDAADVWTRGVECSAFSHGYAEGVCTMLKVEFVGWTKAEVRSIIGESGTGWCVLEEVTSSRAFHDDEEAISDTSSNFSSSNFSSVSEDRHGSPIDSIIDPAQSLHLPTLDFSSSFLAASSIPPAVPLYRTQSIGRNVFNDDDDADFDPWLDSESSPGRGLSGASSWVDSPSLNGWSGFSSQFVESTHDSIHDEYPFF